MAERCQEVLDWHRTGLLSGDRLRALADTLHDHIHDHQRLHIAEDKTAAEAMQYVIDHTCTPDQGWPVAWRYRSYIEPIWEYEDQRLTDDDLARTEEGFEEQPLYAGQAVTPAEITQENITIGMMVGDRERLTAERDAAAEEIERLRAQVERAKAFVDFVIDGYPMVDIGHEDYRVNVYAAALDCRSVITSQEPT